VTKKPKGCAIFYWLVISRAVTEQYRQTVALSSSDLQTSVMNTATNLPHQVCSRLHYKAKQRITLQRVMRCFYY